MFRLPSSQQDFASNNAGPAQNQGGDIKSVTIAICTWNRAASLDRTLGSLSQLTIPPGVRWEVLVVNNNSSDNTDEVIRKHQGSLPVCRVFEERQGKSFALNTAVSEASGELILWTDDDAIVDRNWVVEYIRAAEEYPDTVFFGGRVEPHFDVEPPAWVIEALPRLSPMLSLRKLIGNGWKFERPGDLPYGVNFSIRAGVQKQHLYDTQLGPVGSQRIHGEETEMMRQLMNAGHTGRWIPSALVHHCIAPERLRIRYFRKYFIGCGRTMARMGIAGKASRRKLVWRGVRHEVKAWFNFLLRKRVAWIENLHRATFTWGVLKEIQDAPPEVPKRYQEIPGENGCEDLLRDAVRNAKGKSRFAVVGARAGRATCFLAESIKLANRGIRLDVIDDWEDTDCTRNADADQRYAAFLANLERASVLQQVLPIRMSPLQASEYYANASLDLAFIDIPASRDAQVEVVRAWAPKVKSGGLLAGTSLAPVSALQELFGDELEINEESWQVQRTDASWRSIENSGDEAHNLNCHLGASASDTKQDVRCNRFPKLFLIGSPRSGTTWVNSILKSHPHVVGTRESHAYSLVYECLEAMGCRSPGVWKELLARYRRSASTNPEVGLHHYVALGDLRRILQQVRRKVRNQPGMSDRDAAHAVVQGVLEHFYHKSTRDNTMLFVEKTPTHVFYADEILTRFPESKVVHVLRDGRDVCVSLQMRSLEAKWAPKSRRDQIKMWAEYAKHGLLITQQDRFAGRTAQIRYEDLKANPCAEIARLYQFAGLVATPALVQKIAEKTDFSRLRRTGTGKHNRKGVVGDWKNHFSAADEAQFRELAGPLFMECGYEFEPQHANGCGLSEAG